RYDATTKDFTPILTRIKGIHPDVLVACCSGPAVTAMSKQMVDIGDVAGIIYSTATATPDVALKTAIGKPLPFPFGFFVSNSVDPVNPGKEWTDFLAAFK